jgi:hypothetical protein
LFSTPPSRSPLHDHLVGLLKAPPKLFCNETQCPVLDAGRGKTKTGYMWSSRRPAVGQPSIRRQLAAVVGAPAVVADARRYPPTMRQLLIASPVLSKSFPDGARRRLAIAKHSEGKAIISCILTIAQLHGDARYHGCTRGPRYTPIFGMCRGDHRAVRPRHGALWRFNFCPSKVKTRVLMAAVIRLGIETDCSFRLILAGLQARGRGSLPP